MKPKEKLTMIKFININIYVHMCILTIKIIIPQTCPNKTIFSKIVKGEVLSENLKGFPC